MPSTFRVNRPLLTLCVSMAGYLHASPLAAQAPALELPDEVIIASEQESADGPVQGYVATRSATASKTDTAIAETPRALSVDPADRRRDQGAQTGQATLRYAPGQRREAY